MKLIGPVAVVGGGISGRAALRLLRHFGITDAVLFDDKPGVGAFSDPRRLLEDFRPQTLVVSPGVPLATPWIRAFSGTITSELALAVSRLEGERVLAVTGSLGKSTTVSLLGAGARALDPHAFAGGNLGVPLGDYVADVLEGRRPRAQWVALELSSFQLENMGALRCEGAAITYLSPNHLERYASLEHYYAVKWALLKRATKVVALNRRGGDLASYAATQGCGLEAARTPEGVELHWAARESLPAAEIARMRLVGLHNADNLALAWALGSVCGWGEASLRAMEDFRGLAHRLETLGSVAGIRFVNDSKATSMDSVLTAVSAACERPGETWLLLGGRDKKLPWDLLAPLARETRVHPVFFGECGAHACQMSGLSGPVLPKLRDALNHLRPLAKDGDTVLLSPGGTSLDEFKNFEDRGRCFAEQVREIFGEPT